MYRVEHDDELRIDFIVHTQRVSRKTAKKLLRRPGVLAQVDSEIEDHWDTYNGERYTGDTYYDILDGNSFDPVDEHALPWERMFYGW